MSTEDMSEFDRILDAVADGDEYTVIRNGEPVAVILDIGRYEAMVAAVNGREADAADREDHT